MNRVVIVGTAGSGKSTLAERLAARSGGVFVDLDALNWGPGWTPAPVSLFRERTTVALLGERWVVAGNYRRLRDIVWGAADTLIWLDYPLPLVLWRLLRRTVRRVLTQEELWGGNRERLRAQFASRDSLFLYAIRTHYRRRREYPADLAKPEYAHLRVFRFRRPGELEHWLAVWPVS
jgi:adenylate kinase family enzyme